MPMRAGDVFEIGPFVVTNSMIVAATAAVILIALAQWATRRVALVPEKPQNVAETVIEGLGSILEPILGREGMRKTFWFFATVFIFIVSCNILSLFPGVGTIGRGEGTAWYNLEIHHPFLRGANADVNMTAAMAISFFFLWLFWSIQALGIGGFLHHIFGPKGGLQGFILVLLVPIFIFAGGIEVISIVFRPVSLTFRLFGNVYGGEYMLESMYQLAPNFAWLILIPFYAFEFLVAIVQALVFCLLTAAFTGMMIKHDEGHGEHHH